MYRNRGIHGRSFAAYLFGKIGENNFRVITEEHRSLNDVHQFPDIAGPRIANKCIDGVGSDFVNVTADCGSIIIDIVIYERRNIFFPIPKGWKGETDYIQPVEEVPAESALFDLMRQIAIGGRHDPDIHMERLLASNSLNLVLLQDPKQFNLQVKRHLSDFVQKDGATMSELEPASPRS